jgi:uncharacterized protein (DUF2062 family)
VPDLLTFVVLALTSYRVGRFILLDSMIDRPRDLLFERLNNPDKLSTRRLWLMELLTCPYCILVWVAAGAVTFWSLVVYDEWIGWAFLLVWPAVAAAALLPWTYIDSE